jgi:hypothetical protein
MSIRRIVLRHFIAALMLAGLPLLGAGAVDAASSKPKEIVVVGSKIEGDVVSVHFDFTYRVSRTDDVQVAGVFWISDPDYGMVGGPIVIGSLSNGEDICDGLIFDGQIASTPPGADRIVVLQLVFAISTDDADCRTETRAGGWQTAVLHTGEFIFRAEIAGLEPSPLVVSGHAHGHLDYLKMVGDPAT